MKFLVAGHCCVDITPALTDRSPGLAPGLLYPVGPLRFAVGGSAPNSSGVLFRLGHDVEAAVAVGDDELGRIIREQLGERGHPVHWIESQLASSYSIVTEHPRHDRTFWQHEGANATFDPRVLDLEGIAPEVLHVGYPSLLPLTCTTPNAVREGFEKAHAAGIATSLDLAHVGDGSVAANVDWEAWLRSTLPHTDVCTPSWDDVTSAHGIHEEPTQAGLEAMAAQLVELGAGIVTISAGSLGFAMCTGSRTRLRAAGTVIARLADAWADRSLWFPADSVPNPFTTVGAGDTLTAGVLHGIAIGLAPAETGELARDLVGRHLRGEPLREPELAS